jgi:hypothetical protein
MVVAAIKAADVDLAQSIAEGVQKLVSKAHSRVYRSHVGQVEAKARIRHQRKRVLQLSHIAAIALPGVHVLKNRPLPKHPERGRVDDYVRVKDDRLDPVRQFKESPGKSCVVSGELLGWSMHRYVVETPSLSTEKINQARELGSR